MRNILNERELGKLEISLKYPIERGKFCYIM